MIQMLNNIIKGILITGIFSISIDYVIAMNNIEAGKEINTTENNFTEDKSATRSESIITETNYISLPITNETNNANLTKKKKKKSKKNKPKIEDSIEDKFKNLTSEFNSITQYIKIITEFTEEVKLQSDLNINQSIKKESDEINNKIGTVDILQEIITEDKQKLDEAVNNKNITDIETCWDDMRTEIESLFKQYYEFLNSSFEIINNFNDGFNIFSINFKKIDNSNTQIIKILATYQNDFQKLNEDYTKKISEIQLQYHKQEMELNKETEEKQKHLEKHINYLNKQNEKLNQEILNLKDELNLTTQEKIEQFNDGNNELNQKISTLMNETSNLKDQLKLSVLEKEKLESIINELKEEVEELINEKQKLNTGNQINIELVDQVLEKNHHLGIEINQLQTENSRIKKEMTRLQKEINILNSKAHILEKTLKNKVIIQESEKNIQLKEEIKQLKKKLLQSNGELEQKNKLYSEILLKLDGSNSKNRELEAKINNDKIKIDELEKLINKNLQSEITNYTSMASNQESLKNENEFLKLQIEYNNQNYLIEKLTTELKNNLFYEQILQNQYFYHENSPLRLRFKDQNGNVLKIDDILYNKYSSIIYNANSNQIYNADQRYMQPNLQTFYTNEKIEFDKVNNIKEQSDIFNVYIQPNIGTDLKEKIKYLKAQTDLNVQNFSIRKLTKDSQDILSVAAAWKDNIDGIYQLDNIPFMAGMINTTNNQLAVYALIFNLPDNIIDFYVYDDHNTIA